ncbi:MAG: DUF1611 domain-containing protein [Pseudomonadota bacterium]
MPDIRLPYLLYLGDAGPEFGAKTAQGVLHWRPEVCLAQARLPGCAVDLRLKDLSFSEAVERGARTLLIGVTNRGGVLPQHWIPHLEEAVKAGLDIASGLHERLADVPELARAAADFGRQLHDVRHPPANLPLATGAKRTGKRVLMIGTDCAVGKKFTALAVHAEMERRGLAATFRPTGQTGVLIAGSGIALDAVPGDFIAGCAEALSPDAPTDHWDVFEGQATVLHPTFAAVTTGLIHGSQPDALVLCHQAGRLEMRGLSGRALPSLRETIDAHLAAAQLTNPGAKCVGVSLNTNDLSERDAHRAIAEASAEVALPATDPVRFGAGALVDALID